MRRSIPWPRGNAGAAAVTLVLCLGLILILDHARGIWLDEAASYWLSRHDIGVGRIFRERWVSDVHPPLYSAYAWLLQPLFGDSLREMRLINLGGLFYAALVWRQAWRRGVDRDFLLLFAVLVASSPFFMLYAAEFRSYFLQLALGACLIVQLRRAHERRGGWALLALTALLLINLHYYGSLTGLILIGIEAAWLCQAGRLRDMLALLLIGLVAAIPLVGSMLAMLASIEPVAVNRISSLRALMAIGVIAGIAALANFAAMTLLLRARSLPADRSFVTMLSVALVALSAAYFLLNLATHNLLPRHMIAAVPISAALVAQLLEDYVKRPGRGFVLMCANAALLALATTGYGLLNKRWETNVGRIEAAIAACPHSGLYALSTMSLLTSEHPLHRVPDIDRFFQMTYELIARDRNLTVTVLPEGTRSPIGQACPELLWIEHLYARPGITDAALARAAGFYGSIAVQRLQRDDSRALLAIHRR